MSKEERVLALVAKQGSVSRKEVQDHLGIAQATAILLLRYMLSRGMLKKSGAGRSQRYYK